MKKKVLILSGGISKERLISLDTGLQVAKELKKNGYKIKISEPDNNLAMWLNGGRFVNPSTGDDKQFTTDSACEASLSAGGCWLTPLIILGIVLLINPIAIFA